MSKALKPCSNCSGIPKVNHLILPKSIEESHAVIKFQVMCEPCTLNKLPQIGKYFATFAWNSLDLAIEDWNSAVDNKNNSDGLA